MTMSTGDSRRSAPQKSTTPAAAGGTDAEATSDEPVGGVLPVKKAMPRANGKSGSGAAAARTAGARTGGAASARTGGAASARTGGAAAPKATASKAAGAKSAPAKSARSTATETIESSPSVFARKSATKSAAGRPAASLGGGKRGGGRGLGGPIKVAERRNWGPIMLFVATGVVAVAIIFWGAWPLIRDSQKGTWQEQAASISGIKNFGDPASPDYNAASTQATHLPGDLTYEVTPPVGGNHNGRWQNCMGDIYPAQIADEHAVHSLEHGAVWITYNPDTLPQDQIDKLANRIRDVPYTLMSPYPNLDSKISLQAWGYQLKVDDANDPRIDAFINALRLNNSREQGAICSSGITDTGTSPLDLPGGEM